ncbi:MAG: lipocalin family protein [Bacteroidota bacterium]
MKTLKYILLLFLALGFSLTLSAQKRIAEPGKMRFVHRVHTPLAAVTKLTGTWMQSYALREEGKIIFTPKPQDEMRWGNYLRFLPNGEVIKGYAARCGNDSNIHSQAGAYTLTGHRLVLYLGGHGVKQYEVLESTPEKLVLAWDEDKKW